MNQLADKPNSNLNHDADFAETEQIIAAIARGEMVVIVDDEDRENEGDLIMAAQFATAEKLALHYKGVKGSSLIAHWLSVPGDCVSNPSGR